MSATYAVYDASKPIGGEIARAADLMRQGIDLMRRAKAAVDRASDGGGTRDALIAGDFGALDSGNANKLYEALYTIAYTLDAADAGGLSLALAAIDKGVSG